MSIPDSNTWYRLTNDYAGSGVSLSTSNITQGNLLQMSSSPAFQAENWQFLSSGGSDYQMRNQAAGPNIRVGTNSVPVPELQDTNSSPDQEWSITANTGGTFAISNVVVGSSLYLDTYSNTLQPFFEAWGHSGQMWNFNSVGPINDVSWSTGLSSSTTAGASATNILSATTTDLSSTTSTSTSSPTVAPKSGSSSLSAGVIAGIAVGSVFIGILLLVALILCIHRRRLIQQKGKRLSPEDLRRQKLPETKEPGN